MINMCNDDDTDIAKMPLLIVRNFLCDLLIRKRKDTNQEHLFVLIFLHFV